MRASLRGPVTAAILLISTSAFADDVSGAKLHYRNGTRAYELGHYGEAVEEYEKAYRLKDDPALLYNIGQAYRLDGKREEAIRAYRSYLHRVPDAPNRTEVESRILDLQRELAQPNKATPPVPDSPPANPPVTTTAHSISAISSQPPVAPAPKRTLRTAGFVLLGVGGLGLVGGAIFVGLAKSANDGVNHPASGVYDPNALSRQRIFESADIGLFAAGGAAAVVGLTLVLLDARSNRTHSRDAQAQVSR